MLEADAEVDRRDFTVSVSLRVAPGERLALFGPSGAGKTTVLEVIAGLVAPRRARIALSGRVLTSTDRPVRAVPPWQRGVGLLRQDPGLFPHLSVRDNLRYARSGRSGPGADDDLAGLAAVLGIDGLLDAMPARLSGGQAHRVALGRLLLARCGALLLDEPYTGLDASLRRVLTELVVALVGEREIPAILVAHELAEAQAFADRLAVLDEGSVLQLGAPDEVVLRPASRRVAELVGYTGFVLGPVSVPGPGSGSVERVAGIHPERVVIGRHQDRGLVLTGRVTACRPAGALWEITMRIGEAAPGKAASDGSASAAIGAAWDGAAGVAGGGVDREPLITARLAEPHAAGQELVVTAVDPPWFDPDGTGLAAATAGSDVPSAGLAELVAGSAGAAGQPGLTGRPGTR